MLKEGKLLVMFPWTGAPIFFDPNLPNVFHDKASYLDEGRILTDYAIKKLKAKKIAIFYQDDEFGRGAMIGARKTLAKYGIKDFVAISHKPEVFDFSQQTKNILNFDPDAILFSSFFETTKNFIRQVGVKNLEKKELLFISDFATDSYQEFLKNKGLRFTVAQIYPSIKTSKFEIIKDFKKEIKDVGYLANSYSLEGYIAASIFVDVIKRIDGEVTKEKIIKIIEGMKDYNLGGLNLTFNPQTKSLVDSIWLDNGKKWIKWSD